MPDITYSHRNGETEPPTVEGWYWFIGATGKQHGMILVHDGYAFEPLSDFDSGSVDLLDGNWWGPVTPPWEQVHA